MWVMIFVGIAIAGLIMVICYAIWLAHKAADVMSEITVLGDRAGQLMELVGQIQLPDQPLPAAAPNDLRPQTTDIG